MGRLDRGGGWASEKKGEQEGANSYKGMINDNSAGNKTKHPSCCQSNEAGTLQDGAPGSALLSDEACALSPLLFRVSSPIHLPSGIF